MRKEIFIRGTGKNGQIGAQDFFLRNSDHSGFASDFAGHSELLLSFVNFLTEM